MEVKRNLILGTLGSWRANAAAAAAASGYYRIS